MLELFLNTVTRRWYDKDGDPFGDGMPRGAYQSRENVKITLCNETPNAGTAGVDVSTWTRDDSLASVSGVSAMLTIDSDRIHKLKGELSGEVSAGAVSTITATIENASNATVPASGTLRLFDESGDYEAIAYTDRSIVDGEATFTVSGSVSGSYAVGSVIDCDQSPYAQAYLDTSASNLEQGELVFYLVIDSQRLRAEMDYSDVATLSIAGLELLVYRTADGASEPITAYLCETYSVTGTLGSVGNEAQPPDATEDKLAGLVDQLLAAGLDVEQQYDSGGNTQFRVRSVSAGGTWSSWITVQKGEPGADGKSFSVDATGLMSERSQYDAGAAGFSFLATDEGNLYIKNSDTSGDWSDAIPFQGPAGADGAPGPANVLTIGTVTTGEPGTQAAASITGEAPNQVLNLTIPRGDKGESGTGSGSGDMLKSVYDTNNDGKVDAADEADDALNIGGKTAAQVAAAVDNSHTHLNKTTIDKLGESSGKLTFNGSEVGGGTAGSVAWDNVTGKPSTFPPASHNHEISDVNGLQSALDAKGTVKTVNGIQPDSSGNVTIETGGGGTVDESRLLPDPQSISSEKSGFPLVFKSDYVADSSFILCFPFDGDIVDYSTNRVQVTNDYVTLASDVPEGSGQSAYFNASACLRGTLPVVLGTSDLTINAWIKLQHTGSNQTFFSTRDGNASSSEAFSFDVHDDGELFMYSTSEHTSRISSAEKMTFGEWHHVRMIRSSNTVKLYLDGKLHAEGTCSNNWTWTAFAIGMLYRKNDSYNQLKGYMSAFQLLNYAMPLEEFTPVFDYGIDINKRFEVAEDNLCDDAIATHNTSLDAHPMQGATTNDYNGLDTNCSWYLSYGDNTSNVNAPANGPFFVMTKKWTNSSGSAGAAMQVAVRNMTGSLTTQEMYIRTASLSGGSLSWHTWQKVGSSAMAGSPNYGAGVDITSAAAQGGYTCTGGGWILASMAGSGETLKINGTTIGTSGRYFITVSTGDAITLEHGATYYSSQITFYPNR